MKKSFLVMLASLFMFSQFGFSGVSKKTNNSLIGIPIKRDIVNFSDDNVPIPIKRTKDILVKKSTTTRIAVAKK